MFINKANIKLYVAALFSALIASSCLNLDETQDGAYGYLTISGIDVDINVSELVPTKSGSTVDTVDITGVRNYSAPQLASASVKVMDSKGVEHEWTGEQLILPLGAYTVSATYGSNTFDAPYFMGTASGTISDNPSSATVKFTLANSVMKVTTDMTEHIDITKPVIISLSDDVSKRVSADFGKYVFVPSGESLKISGTNKAGASFTATLDEQIIPGKAYYVTLSKEGANLPTLTLPAQQDGAWGGRLYVNPIASVSGMSEESLSKIVYKVYSDNLCTQLVAASEEGALVVDGLTNGATYYVQAQVGAITSDVDTINVVAPTVDVSHFNDSNGDLAGSKAVLDLKLNDFLNERVDVSEIILANGTNQMRNATASGEMSVINDWPYIPQGTDYKLTVSHKLIKSESESVSSMTPIEVPAPEFGVTVSGYTTYEKYLEYKQNGQAATLAEANSAGKAEYIFQIASTISGISETLLNNTNYTTKVFYTCGPYNEVEFNFVNGDGDTNASTLIHNIGDVSDFSWGENTLTAKVVFAGTEKSSSKSCHITGLPYSSVPTINDETHPWTIDAQNWAAKFSWGANEFYMYTDSASGTYNKIGSPLFHVPTNINCTIAISAHGCRHASIKSTIEWRVYSGNSTADFDATYNNNEYKVYNINSLMLNSNSPKIQLESRKYTAYCKSYINNVSIKYR